MNETYDKKEIRARFEELANLCYSIYQDYLKYIHSIEDPTFAISSHTESRLEKTEGKKRIVQYTYPIIDFLRLMIMQKKFPEKFPNYLDLNKIQRIEELENFLFPRTLAGTLNSFFYQFGFRDKKLNRKDIQAVIEYLMDLTPGNTLNVTFFLPLDNLDLEGLTLKFSDGTVIREITDQEFIRHMESKRGEWIHYMSPIRPEPSYVLARTYTITIDENLKIAKKDSEKYFVCANVLKRWADSLLLALPNPVYISTGYTYSNNPYTKLWHEIYINRIFHPFTSFDPITFPPPSRAKIDNSVQKIIEKVYSLLSRFHSDPSHKLFKTEFEVSFRRLETSMRRKEFIDAILDNAIGVEILLTKAEETESLKFKFERRGSYLLSPPDKRTKAANQLREMYLIRSKFVHSAKKIRRGHVKDLIGPVNTIDFPEFFEIRWAIFHLHRKLLVQYLKVLTYVWDANIEIKNHNELISKIDDWMLEEKKLQEIYDQE